MPFKPVGNLKHNVLPALAAVEHAAAVGEPTSTVVELANLAGGDLQHPHPHNRLRNLLPVRADVLYRRPSDRSRNAAKTLHAGAILADGQSYQLIPVLSRAGVEE